MLKQQLEPLLLAAFGHLSAAGALGRKCQPRAGLRFCEGCPATSSVLSMASWEVLLLSHGLDVLLTPGDLLAETVPCCVLALLGELCLLCPLLEGGTHTSGLQEV